MSKCIVCGPAFIGACPHGALEKIGMPSPFAKIEKLRAKCERYEQLLKLAKNKKHEGMSDEFFQGWISCILYFKIHTDLFDHPLSDEAKEALEEK